MRWYFVVGASSAFVVAGASLLLSLNRPARASTPPAPQAEPGCQDRDGDGYGLGCRAGRDCNDQDPNVHPNQTETCNLRDDDCNGLVDDLQGCVAPSVDSTLIRVPPINALIGSPEGAEDERPQHQISVSGFRIDRHEVTNGQYAACVKAGACSPPSLRSSNLRKEYFDDPRFTDYPVIFVNWNQADTYCRHAGGRLPTEAEWETVARGPAPSSSVFPWGNQTPDCTRANMGGPGSCVGDTDRVARRPLGNSPLGAADMAGNVWEWVADWYAADYYASSPAADPTGPQDGHLKVMRGGCWVSGASSLRVSCRKAELPSTWAYNVGFRCAYAEGR